MSHLTWIKSSDSDSSGSECVEVATTPTVVHVRDSRRIGGAVLRLGSSSWAGFLRGVQDGSAFGG